MNKDGIPVVTENIIFPLCLLSLEYESSQDKANKLISYSVVEYASSLEGSVDLEDGNYYFIEYQNEMEGIIKTLLCNLYYEDSIEVDTAIKNHTELKEFVNRFENTYGRDSLVKVHSGLVKDLANEKFSERDFNIYCGLRSIVGEKKICRVTNRNIAIRSKGCKSKKVYDNFGGELLTDKQILWSIKKLEARNFFNRLTACKRLTFYSFKIKNKENFMEEILNNVVSKKATKPSLSNELDKRINNKLNKLQTKKNKKQNCNIVSMSEYIRAKQCS